MKLLSVNIAQPREVLISGKPVLTGIYKLPVADRIWLRRLQLDGDGQADLSVHGGPHQAVYSYPSEHYPHWQQVLGGGSLGFGTFGENFTVAGLLEVDVCLGDIWRVGKTAVIQVTMPRLPCFKFAHKTGRPAVLKEFLQSGYSGFYHRVLSEGEVGAGDEIVLIERDVRNVTVREALGLQKLHEGDSGRLQLALTIPSLAPLLREIFAARLTSMEA